MAEESKLQWVFEILDKMSGPGSRMAAAMRTFGATLGKVGTGAKGAATHLGDLRHALFETFGIARDAFEVFKFGAEKAFDFGKELVTTAGNMEETRKQFRYLLGSASEADKLTRAMYSFADAARLDVNMVMGFAGELARMGVGKTAREIEVLVQAATDLEKIGAGGGAAFTELLFRIINGGVISERALLALGRAGINLDDVLKDLGKHFTGGFAGTKETLPALQKYLSENPAAKLGVATVVLDAIAKKGGGKLGDITKDFSHDINAQLQALPNIWDATMRKIASGPGMKAFHGAFENFLKVLEPGGPFASALNKMVNGPVADFFKQFSGPEGLKRLQGVFDGLGKAVTTLADAMLKLLDVTARVLEQAGKKGTGTYDATLHNLGGIDPKDFLGNPGSPLRELLSPTGTPIGGFQAVPLTPPKIVPTPKGSTGMNVNIHIDAPGATREDADHIAGKLASVMSRIAQEMGA